MGKRIQKVSLNNLGSRVLELGYVGEHEHTRIEIDCTDVLWDYPNAECSMVVQPPTGDMYPLTPVRDENSIIWLVTDSDVVYNGTGRVQITFTNDGEIVKSAIASTRIDQSIMATGPVPTPLENWMEQAEETAHQIALTAKDEVIEQIQDAAEEARESIPADYTTLSDDVSGLKSALTSLDTQVNGGVIYTPTTINTSDLTLTGYYIDATSIKWVYHQNNNRGYYISLVGYDKISITAGNYPTQIAFLTEFDPTAGETPAFAGGTTLVIVSDSYESVVPDDAMYLYLRRIDADGHNLDPSLIVFYTESHTSSSIVGQLESIEDDIDALTSDLAIADSSVETINTALFGTEEVERTIQTSELTISGYYINNNGYKWMYNQNNNRGYFISLDGYKKIKITTTASYKAELAFLTDFAPVVDTVADFASGTSLYSVNVGTTLEADIPDDATYLYVRRMDSSGHIITPQEILFYYDRYKSDSLASLTSVNDTIHFRIATYNVGDFTGGNMTTGSDELALAYRQVISETGSDAIGIQADVEYYTGTTTPFDELYSPMFKYHAPYGSNQYNYHDCISDYAIIDSTDIPFTSYYAHSHFTHYSLNVKGITLNVIDVHLDWYDITIRHSQISEILDYIADLDHVVVIGDFNPANRTNGTYNDPDNLYMWDTDYAIWTDAGYSIANCGALGEYNTCHSDQGGYWFPCDQIVVSNDIKIKAVGVVKESWHNDHIPLWADLCIYK